MKAYINHIIFQEIANLAKHEKVEIYVIGGFVRDIFLKRPSKDIDIVVIGNGITFAKKIAKIFHVKLAVFKNFGTAMLTVADWRIEFVGARKESYQSDSRKPFVSAGTLEDDQKRRDFAINAMAISLNQKNFGKLLDPFNGRNDLKKQLIRTPQCPDITFSDDPLRMMRAIRFATQLGFHIEDKTLQAIARNKERIGIVSMERISEELNKIMLASQPSTGFVLLESTGLLALIFPELQAMKGRESVNGIEHKDNFYHSLKVLDKLAEKNKNLWLRWAALLHDIGKPVTKKFVDGQGWTFHIHNYMGAKMIKHIFRKLKLPLNEKMQFVKKMVALHMRPIALVEEEVTDSAIRRLLFEAGDDIDALMMLCEADITSKNEKKVQRYLQNFKYVRKRLKEVEEKDAVRNFQPPVSGEVIMKTFKLKPCRKIGELKTAIKEAILDGKIPNEYEAAYQFMLEVGKKMGLQKNEPRVE